MTQSDRRKLEAAADDTIAKMRAARSATNEAGAATTRGAASTELQPLLDRVRVTHEAALDAARNLATSLTAAEVQSISSTVQLAVAKVEAAKTAADQLGSAPTQAQANTTRDADDEAVMHVVDLKGAFQNASELEHISTSRLGDLLGWFTQLTSQQVLGLAAGTAVFILATAGLVALGFGMFGPQSIVEKLAKVDYARGLITYILAVGTMAIAVVLVVSAVLGGDAGKDSFSRGKEILTILIGIFGTILGFYYGSEQKGTSASPTPSPSPSAIASPNPSPSLSPFPSPSAVASSSSSLSPGSTSSPGPSPTPSGSG